jgi:hypothetical protein
MYGGSPNLGQMLFKYCCIKCNDFGKTLVVDCLNSPRYFLGLERAPHVGGGGGCAHGCAPAPWSLYERKVRVITLYRFVEEDN